MLINAKVVKVTTSGLVVKSFFSGGEVTVNCEDSSSFSIGDCVRITFKPISSGADPTFVHAQTILKTRSVNADSRILNMHGNKLKTPFSAKSCGKGIGRNQSPGESEIIYGGSILDPAEPDEHLNIYDDEILRDAEMEYIEGETETDMHRRNSYSYHSPHHSMQRPPNNMPCPNCMPNRPMPSVKMNAIVIGRQNGRLTVRQFDSSRTIIVRTPHVMHFCVGQKISIVYDMMTMSNPPIVNALDIEAIC